MCGLVLRGGASAAVLGTRPLWGASHSTSWGRLAAVHTHSRPAGPPISDRGRCIQAPSSAPWLFPEQTVGSTRRVSAWPGVWGWGYAGPRLRAQPESPRGVGQAGTSGRRRNRERLPVRQSETRGSKLSSGMSPPLEWLPDHPPHGSNPQVVRRPWATVSSATWLWDP